MLVYTIQLLLLRLYTRLTTGIICLLPYYILQVGHSLRQAQQNTQVLYIELGVFIYAVLLNIIPTYLLYNALHSHLGSQRVCPF